MDIFQRDSQRRCCHLGKRRIRPLSNLRLSKLNLDGPILVQYHAAGRGLQRDRPHRRIVPESCNANALPDISRLIAIRFCLPDIIRMRDRLIHALAEGVLIILVLRESIHESLRHQVLSPEFQRGHANRLCHVVRVAFHGKHSLGNPISSHGACHRAVGKYRIGICLHIRAGIQLRERAHSLCHYAVTMGRVGPLIGERLQFPGHECPVRPDIGYNMASDSMPYPVAGKGLFPAYIQLDQMASRHLA